MGRYRVKVNLPQSANGEPSPLMLVLDRTDSCWIQFTENKFGKQYVADCRQFPINLTQEIGLPNDWACNAAEDGADVRRGKQQLLPHKLWPMPFVVVHADQVLSRPM